jgi:hypothetical protein
MKGMEMARELYENVFRDVLASEFAPWEERIAVGLAGPGSECFGFDDEISRDHDLVPRLCLWLTEKDMAETGPRLRRRFDELTADLPQPSEAARDRSGVIGTAEFYRRFTGCPGAPDGPMQWLRVSDRYLACAVNGEVFRDDLGEFSAIRREISKGYPPDVRRKKLAARLFAMGQAGQYNLPRCIKRGDAVASALALSEFIRAALGAIYLLNGRYAPFYKWLYRGALDLPLCRDAVAAAGELADCPKGEREERVESICAMLLPQLRLQGLSDTDGDFMVDQAFSVAAGIEDPQLAALDVSIG